MPQEETSTAAAALSGRQRTLLSQLLQDVRTTLSHINLPNVTPLAALDATAIDALKDLYYMVNTEDPLNVMPARRHLLETGVVPSCITPIVSALHADPAATTNPKRWSVPIYQTLRLLSVLTLPILPENDLLHRGCSLDEHTINLRHHLAVSRSVVAAFVSLLQYYVDRKAAKAAACAPAEDAKLEDARIDNILRFFRNLLSPPRPAVGPHIAQRDRGVHLAVVGALVSADFYSTLAILFSSREDAHSQYTDLVFLVADVYALTYRHSTPRQIYLSFRKGPSSVKVEAPASKSVFDNPQSLPPEKTIKKSQTRASSLRAALQRERTVIGGSRAVRASARWTSRHSGGFTVAPKPPAANQLSEGHATSRNPSVKRIISARNAIQSKLSFNPKRPFQESIQVNSEILCLQAAKGRSKRGAVPEQAFESVRKDLQHDGLHGVVTLTVEMVEVCFQFFTRELRERIDEMKQRSQAEETSTLSKAQRSFLVIVGSVVGFQRERFGKVYKEANQNLTPASAQLHENSMRSVLSSDFKIVKTEWTAVEAGIELQTFQLVFRVLVESCEALRESGKDDIKVETVEMSTFAVLEMMKMLQGMAATVDRESAEELDNSPEQKPSLTPRELALNTLEQLFERQSFLNAPAELAKDFTAKLYSFRHLTNIIEVAHAFTTILLDEQELARLQVTKKKRKPKKKKIVEEADDEYNPNSQNQGVAAEHTGPPESEQVNREADRSQDKEGTDEARQRKTKKVVVSDDEEAAPRIATAVHPESSSAGPTTTATDSSDTPQSACISADVDAPALSTDSASAPELPRAREDKKSADKTGSKPELREGGGAGLPPKLNHALLEDADEEEQGEKVPASNAEKKLSKVQQMLLADAQNEPAKDDEAKPEKLSKVQTLLLADANLKGNHVEPSKLISTVEQMRKEAEQNRERVTVAAGEDGSDSGESEEEPEVKEIESIGIIRRFAHARALQTLVLPVRAALCEASSLSGSVHPIPEGASPLLSPIVVAKSAHVVASVWKVAKIRERGVLQGQFFSYSNMHLMNIAIAAAKQGNIRKDSVLEKLSVFAKDVAKGFFSWLAINPGLALDMFFPMDKNSCHMYTTCIHQKDLQQARENAAEDSGNESDLALLDIEPRMSSGVNSGSRRIPDRASRGKTSRGKRMMQQRRREERANIEDDEDVDDIDNLNIGVAEGEMSDELARDSSAVREGSQGEGAGKVDKADADDKKKFSRSRTAKRRRMQAFDPFASDDEVLEGKVQKKRKAKKVAAKVKKAAEKKGAAAEAKRTFSSSDEYSGFDSDGATDEERQKAVTDIYHKPKLNLSESPEMDEDEEEESADQAGADNSKPKATAKHRSLALRKRRDSDEESLLRGEESSGSAAKTWPDMPPLTGDHDKNASYDLASPNTSPSSAPAKSKLVSASGTAEKATSERKARRVVVSDEDSD